MRALKDPDMAIKSVLFDFGRTLSDGALDWESYHERLRSILAGRGYLVEMSGLKKALRGALGDLNRVRVCFFCMPTLKDMFLLVTYNISNMGKNTEENNRNENIAIRSLKRLYAWLNVESKHWGKRLVKVSLALIFFSLLYSALSFWILPETYEYLGIGNDTYPSSAYRDFIVDRPLFNTRIITSIFLHIATLGPIGVLGWMLQTIAISGTYILLLKMLEILDDSDPKKPPIPYVNLAMGSVLVGIIILTSSTRALNIPSRLTNVLTIALLVIVVWGLEKIRKSMSNSKKFVEQEDDGDKQ